MLGTALSMEQRLQACLPIRSGGCGIKSPLLTQASARLSALLSFIHRGADAIGLPEGCRKIDPKHINPLLDDLQKRLGPNFDILRTWRADLNSLNICESNHLSQKWWSDHIATAAFHRMLDRVTPRDQARILEQQGSLGANWMALYPSPTLSSIFPSDSYRTGMKWWLGLPILSKPEESRCPGCSSPIDAYGDHLICCPRNNFTARHSAVLEAVSQILTEAGQSHTKEVALPGATSQELRPADILIPNWTAGKPTALDVTICHGWQIAQQIGVSRERWRKFLRQREEAKHEKYDVPCKTASWHFVAMAFGTWGGMGPEGHKTLKRIIAQAAGAWEGERKGAETDFLRQRVATALMSSIIPILQRRLQVQTHQ